MTCYSTIREGLALLSIAVATPLAAQEAHLPAASEETASEEDDNPQSLLPADMTADQFIQFFTQFSANPAIAAALAPEFDRLMQPGERMEGWETQGVDILALLRASKGGLESTLLRDLEEDILTVTDLSGVARPDLSGFSSYALRPDPIGLVAERGFTSFVPGVWFEIAMQREQVGNALCYGGYHGVTLHTKRPYTQWSRKELMLVAAVFAAVDRMSSLEFCAIYSRDKDGGFTTRGVLPDGRDLPVMNAEGDAMVIMATSELSAFMQREPKPDRDE